MSYAVMGFGADDSLIVQWANGTQSAVANGTGPVCGYQIAAQAMLHDLGYGAGKPNMMDPGFNDAFHQFALARGIAHAVGAPITNEMCARMLSEWKAMAAPTAANARVWEVKPGAAPPPPQACPVGYDWNAASKGCQQHAEAARSEAIDPGTMVAEAPPSVMQRIALPTTAVTGMSPVVKYALIGGAALLVVAVVATKARKKTASAAA